MIRLSPAADSTAWLQVPADMVGGEVARVGLRWLSPAERDELDRAARRAATSPVEQWSGAPGEGRPAAAEIRLVPHTDFVVYSGQLVQLTLARQIVEWSGFDMAPDADAMLALVQGFPAAAYWIYQRGRECAHWEDGVPFDDSETSPSGSATTPEQPPDADPATRPD